MASLGSKELRVRNEIWLTCLYMSAASVSVDYVLISPVELHAVAMTSPFQAVKSRLEYMQPQESSMWQIERVK